MNDGLTQNSFFHMMRGFNENPKPVNADELNTSFIGYAGMQSLNPNHVIQNRQESLKSLSEEYLN